MTYEAGYEFGDWDGRQAARPICKVFNAILREFCNREEDSHCAHAATPEHLEQCWKQHHTFNPHAKLFVPGQERK